METNQRRISIIGLLAVLLAGLYLATVTVEPVFAFNYQSSPKIINMDNGIKIDNSGNQYGKEKIYNGNSPGNGYGQINPNDHQGDPFKIKNHPVLK